MNNSNRRETFAHLTSCLQHLTTVIIWESKIFTHCYVFPSNLNI